MTGQDPPPAEPSRERAGATPGPTPGPLCRGLVEDAEGDRPGDPGDPGPIMADGGSVDVPTLPDDPGPSSYRVMLDRLDTAAEECQRKIESGRVRDPENEKVRIRWIKALGYITNIQRQVQADSDLEEIQATLEEAGYEVP